MTSAAATHDSLIGERRARSLAGARAQTVRIRLLRAALLIAMAAVAGNAIVQAVLSGARASSEPAFAPASDAERITNPRFTGRDRAGTPFVVIADAAVRRLGGVTPLTDLERPALSYAWLEGADDGSQALAETGVFDEAAETLFLRTNVRFTTPTGYSFNAPSARISLREGTVSGDEGVSGTAPWGGVRADAFEVQDGANRVILTGDVRTRIYPGGEAP
ncbi:hypothetical protein F1654_09855 [Alkalicaulis satelles]|uniref:LPS export ABC transporter periplasmic protein LptC n=1 Tax=Alkalicaulis satelles TaxID=2609175 RepID=A0A5M6ZIC7_9PROT|nr:LPS export ABC transporter periplasmic protein LptC [Alkalicaulis satelles]KAA5804070.1 hypothetical protein F1654_09855 [Alkalicaulis satelles]